MLDAQKEEYCDVVRVHLFREFSYLICAIVERWRDNGAKNEISLSSRFIQKLERVVRKGIMKVKQQ